MLLIKWYKQKISFVAFDFSEHFINKVEKWSVTKSIQSKSNISDGKFELCALS